MERLAAGSAVAERRHRAITFDASRVPSPMPLSRHEGPNELPPENGNLLISQHEENRDVEC